jgi:hypothetical protein
VAVNLQREFPVQSYPPLPLFIHHNLGYLHRLIHRD